MSNVVRASVLGTSMLAFLLATGCTPEKHATKRSGSAAPSSSGQLPRPLPSAVAAATTSSSEARASGPAASSAARVIVHSFDAGTNACRLVYGPLQLPFVGDVTLAPARAGVLVVSHHDGIPTVTRVEPGDAEAPERSTTDAAVPRVSSPPCAVAGGFSFCMDPSGTIHQRSLESEGRDVVVARARPLSSFAAEAFEGGHVLLAYLATRQTTEGLVSEAYASVDGGPPIRLSDDGSGTTHISLARRGTAIVALLVDGRTAMTPVHARTLSLVQGKLIEGEDAVVFVGGGAEPSTRGALGVSATGAAYALIPISGEGGFGLATTRLDDPPRIDEPVSWSLYLNGLDPAPIAATEGTSPVRVARVRPLEAQADAPRGLELGRIDDAGAFVSYGLVGSKGRVKAAAITTDQAGFVWLALTDGTGTWLERRSCP